MLSYLIQLADYYDKKGAYKYANIIDSFIITSQSFEGQDTEAVEPTRARELGFNDDPEGEERFIGSKSTDSEISPADNVYLELDNNHPLIGLIIEYMKNVYMVADEGRAGGSILVSKINQIISEGLRYNADTLKYHKNIDDNLNPIYPTQFKNLLERVEKLVRQRFKPIGRINYATVKDLVDILYKNYSETYIEDYIGLKSTEQDYMSADREEPEEPRPNFLSTKNRIVNRKQDEYEAKMFNDADQEYMVDLERQTNNERYRDRMNKRKQQVIEKYPEAWHDILLPPED